MPNLDLRLGCSLELLNRLPDESVDLVLTDPPYGNNDVYGRSHKSIRGDEHPLNALFALTAVYRLLKDDRVCFCFINVQQFPFVESFVTRYTAFKVRDVLVWDKRRMGFGHAFRKRHELILVLEKGQPSYRSRGQANVVACPRVVRPQHPHQKPVGLLKTLIGHASDQGDTVLDPFMGSGSTAVAARDMNRHFIGFELDADYFKLARQRIVSAA